MNLNVFKNTDPIEVQCLTDQMDAVLGVIIESGELHSDIENRELLVLYRARFNFLVEQSLQRN